MLYVDWELGGRKKLYGKDFFYQNFVRVGLQETNNFFFLGLYSRLTSV